MSYVFTYWKLLHGIYIKRTRKSGWIKTKGKKDAGWI